MVAVLGSIDFKQADLPLALAVVLRCWVPASVTGTEAKQIALRWCGPLGAVGSGILAALPAAGEPFDAQPSPGYVEPRLRSLTLDQALGQLRNGVQTLSSLSLAVDLADGEGRSSARIDTTDDALGARPYLHPWRGMPLTARQYADALRELAQIGRWAGQPIDVYAVRLDSDARGLVAQPLMRGVVDRNPTDLSDEGFKLTAVQEIVGVDDPMPHTRWPGSPDDAGWSDETTATVNGSAYGGVLDSFHPGAGWSFDGQPVTGAYVVRERDRGCNVGVITGEAPSDDLVWRECPVYGWQTNPSTSPADVFVFVHLSPQKDVFANKAAWKQGSTGTVYEVDRIGVSAGGWVRTFNNTDPACGPLGSCAQISTDEGNIDSILDDDESIYLCQLAGPGVAPADYVTENAEVTLLAGTPAAFSPGDVVDDAEILEHLFALAGFDASRWAPGAIVDFAANAPAVAGTTQWREFHCAIPLAIRTEVPTLRKVVGDLLELVQADLVEEWVDSVQDLRLVPYRRRPNPAEPFDEGRADHHLVRDHDLLDSHLGAAPGWQILDDPDRYYGNQHLLESATYNTEPDVVADELELTKQDRQPRVELDEQAVDARNGVVARTDRTQLFVWEPPNYGPAGWNGGIVDASKVHSKTRAQMHKTWACTLGHNGLAVGLAHAIKPEVAGVGIGAGHVRRRRVILGARLEVQITSYHAEFVRGSEEGEGD